MSTARRDTLLDIQHRIQARWRAEGAFEVDAPGDFDERRGWSLDEVRTGRKEPFFVTFPYIYTNGPIHLGHAYSLSKAEFAVAYGRLRGRTCLFPFGFHCTGMPIQASANRLARELQEFGPTGPPPPPPRPTAATAENGATPAAAMKKKVEAKTGRQVYQYHMLLSSGVPPEEIPRFADPHQWLRYWPPQGMRDAQSLGLHVDWRRSFITTDANPYYDSFIRWQFERLRGAGRIKFGKRYTIYSPLDRQACADHDRATGEGVAPQEYVLIKMEVLRPYPEPLRALEQQACGVYLAAATLRPETMYGQTNCWVQPDGEYGAYALSADGAEVLVMTARAARNLAYQGVAPEFGRERRLAGPFLGRELLGTALRSPRAPRTPIYVLPMLTVSTGKGTGVVTSVPSDAPDDYRALQDLKEKAALRDKYGVHDEWVLPFEPVPIIEVPGYGCLPGVAACEQLKVRSQNDRELLARAKDEVYLRGFYDGRLLVGAYAGQRVQEVKQRIRQEMLEAGEALLYSEPEREVISRSGDECVVALCDQWYIEYGEAEWKRLARRCLDAMETYHAETRRGFEAVLEWLHEWACSRSFGLGSRLPWDPQYVIESLSDSTIYMAYYTVAHLLHRDLAGAEPGIAGPPDRLTGAVWDYVLLGEGDAEALPIPPAVARQLRREFQYWYPLNLRVSGKDLIGNHLTFFIYNHVALFPEDKWPLAVRANGHVMINNEKMSKSTGNFLTLQEAVQRYTADGVRFALADAGDGVDDASFQVKTADEAILKLTTLLSLASEGVRCAPEMRDARQPLQFWDRFFEAEVDRLVEAAAEAYDRMAFRDALKGAFYEMQDALGVWRVAVGADADMRHMHRAVWEQYIRAQVQVLYPICPHTCEWMWREVLHAGQEAPPLRWPQAAAERRERAAILAAGQYLQNLLHRLRLAIQRRAPVPVRRGRDDGDHGAADRAPAEPSGGCSLELHVRTTLTDWQTRCVALVRAAYDPHTRCFADDLPKRIASDAVLRRVLKKAMPLAMHLRNTGQLELQLPFDEAAVLQENRAYIRDQLGLQQQVQVCVDDEEGERRGALLGEPAIVLR